MGSKQRQRRRRDPVDATGMADCSRPLALQPVANFVGEAGQGGVVDIVGEHDAFVAPIGFDVGGLAAEIDVVFGVNFELPCDGGPGGCSAELAGLMAYTQQIHVESNRSRHPERQLSEESIPSVDVMAFAVLRQQETAFLRLLARIVARQ